MLSILPSVITAPGSILLYDLYRYAPLILAIGAFSAVAPTYMSQSGNIPDHWKFLASRIGVIALLAMAAMSAIIVAFNEYKFESE